MRNRFLGFVAHVGEAKSLAFEFAVAAVDHEMMLFAQIAQELGNVDFTTVFDTGECDRAITFGGEKLEPTLPHPVVDERIRAPVPFVPVR